MAERLPGPGLEAGRAAASGGLHGRAAVPGTGYGGLYIPAMHMLRPAVEWAMTMIEQRLAEFTEMDVEAVRHMAVEAYTYCPWEVIHVRGNLALVAHSLTTLRYGRSILGEDVMTVEFVETGLVTGSRPPSSLEDYHRQVMQEGLDQLDAAWPIMTDGATESFTRALKDLRMVGGYLEAVVAGRFLHRGIAEGHFG